MSHVTEHCEKPKITRRWKQVGMVYACTCGRLYRAEVVGTVGGYFWTWGSVTSPNLSAPRSSV